MFLVKDIDDEDDSVTPIDTHVGDTANPIETGYVQGESDSAHAVFDTYCLTHWTSPESPS